MRREIGPQATCVQDTAQADRTIRFVSTGHRVAHSSGDRAIHYISTDDRVAHAQADRTIRYVSTGDRVGRA
eukprot:279331-Rhodomonas_salina.1